MYALIGRRLLQLPVVLLVISALVFFGLRLGPFDPTVVAAEASRDPEVVETLRHEYGLDRPLVEQYGTFISGIAHGDFGRSFISNRPVTASILDRIPATLELAFASIIVGTLLGVGLGFIAAFRRDTYVDTGARVLTLLGLSIPTFWLGIVAIAIFAVGLGWLPAGGRYSVREPYEAITGFILLDSLLQKDMDAFASAVRHLIMPALTLSAFVASLIGRITRASIVEQSGAFYTTAALAKGISRTRVFVRHSFRNALLPIITIVGLQFGLVLGGAVITETVFNWPGMGKFLVDAINMRDFPQIQAAIFVLASMYVFVNLAVDILYGVADPRARL